MTEERKTYESGAERSKLDDVRFDLISPIGLRRLAATYAEGAVKYSDHNWRKGFPTSSLLNHVLTHLCNYAQGIADEDELAHAAWGIFALMEQEVTQPALDDRWVFGPQDTFASGMDSSYMAEAPVLETPAIPPAERCGIACRCRQAPLHYCQKPVGHVGFHGGLSDVGGWE